MILGAYSREAPVVVYSGLSHIVMQPYLWHLTRKMSLIHTLPQMIAGRPISVLF